MIIAIDFDGTFTKRPLHFTNFINAIMANGDNAILITNRKNTSYDRSFVMGFLPKSFPNIDIIFCGERSKREVAREKGFEVDIWIDDNPVLVDFGIQGYEELYKRDPSAIKG